ncbi:hypothetical protein C7999DRAFT_27445 [Corynascus novoguineensis]|uniref:Uncharacterized protein n=1 Tax=Corynascus novoguineensis TaxID=1126955 RepID=A0AAN7HPD6_9PEZI|nr:hypothetical protein C7999DRAFT_27445 [Corynascus novoguineensis]
MLHSVDTPEPPPFFLSRSSLTPDGLFDNQTADMFDEPENSLMCLYLPDSGQGGESSGGLFYYQGHHRAVFMHMDDHGFGLPFNAHPELWHPFETIFSSWIDLVHIGKKNQGLAPGLRRPIQRRRTDDPAGVPLCRSRGLGRGRPNRPTESVRQQLRGGEPKPGVRRCVQQAVDRDAYDNVKKGFRLLLPYAPEGGGETRVRHGYKPFGGDYYRPQRLKHLLDH